MQDTKIPVILPKAVFIADSHFMPQHALNDNSLIELKTDIWEGNLISLFIFLEKNPPPQVFLLGDIAHFFIGHIPSSIKEHHLFIQTINALAKKCEVFYFEGNHDFGLNTKIFPNIKIYPRTLQPAYFLFENSNVLISHGDCFIGWKYECYIRFINSSLILSFLKILDIATFGMLYKYIAKKISDKKIKSLYLKNEDFQYFVKNRFIKYKKYAKSINLNPIDIIIEGHFHIGKNQQGFFSLPSFYCCKKIFIIESQKNTGETNG